MTDKLWMLHIQGPDDIVAAPSREEADRVTAALHAFWAEHTAKRRAEIAADGGEPSYYPSIKVVAVEWDGSPEDHANSVAEYWPEYASCYASLPLGETTA